MENENNANIIPEPTPDPGDSHFVIKIPRRGIKTFFKFAVPGLLVLSLGLNYALLKALRFNSLHHRSTSITKEFQDFEKDFDFDFDFDADRTEPFKGGRVRIYEDGSDNFYFEEFFGNESQSERSFGPKEFFYKNQGRADSN